MTNQKRRYSRLNELSKQERIARAKQMTPAERLQAYISHISPMNEIARAGAAERQSNKAQPITSSDE